MKTLAIDRPEGRGPSAGESTRSVDRIRRAAVDLFGMHGYRATSTRKLAARAGLTAGSLYNHFPSKQALLFDILLSAHTVSLGRLRTVLTVAADPTATLRQAVRSHVLFHVEDPVAIAVVYRDIEYLGPEEHATILKLRRTYERAFVGLLGRGVREGVFDVDDPRLAAIAIISMGIRVSSWFRPNGRLSAEEVADAYAEYAVRLVGGRCHRTPRVPRGVR